MKECISNSSETESAKNTPCTLNVTRKSNVIRLTFAHTNINSIKNKFDMIASQVKGNANVIMISETKLEDAFPVDQFVLECFSKPFLEGFSKPFRVHLNKNWGLHLALCL